MLLVVVGYHLMLDGPHALRCVFSNIRCFVQSICLSLCSLSLLPSAFFCPLTPFSPLLFFFSLSPLRGTCTRIHRSESVCVRRSMVVPALLYTAACTKACPTCHCSAPAWLRHTWRARAPTLQPLSSGVVRTGACSCLRRLKQRGVHHVLLLCSPPMWRVPRYSPACHRSIHQCGANRDSRCPSDYTGCKCRSFGNP